MANISKSLTKFLKPSTERLASLTQRSQSSSTKNDMEDVIYGPEHWEIRNAIGKVHSFSF